MFTSDQSITFIIGLILNQSIPSKQAWENAVKFKDRLKNMDGVYTINFISQLEIEEIESIMREGTTVLHRFPKNMSIYIKKMARTISVKYTKISDIWNHNNDVYNEDTIIKNLLEIPGIGKHKAVQGLFILSLAYPICVSKKHEYYMKMKCPDFLENYFDELDIILKS